VHTLQAVTSRHLRALLSVCGGCFVWGFGALFLSCVCVSVAGVLFSVGVLTLMTAMLMLPLTAATSFEHRGPQCLLTLTRSTSPPP